MNNSSVSFADASALALAFEETEVSHSRAFEQPRDRLQHVLQSLRYAHELCAAQERFDLALALVRAAASHLDTLQRQQRQQQRGGGGQQQLTSCIANAAAAVARLTEVCESRLSGSSALRRERQAANPQQRHQPASESVTADPASSLRFASARAREALLLLDAGDEVPARFAAAEVEHELGELRRSQLAEPFASAHLQLLLGQWRRAWPLPPAPSVSAQTSSSLSSSSSDPIHFFARSLRDLLRAAADSFRSSLPAPHQRQQLESEFLLALAVDGMLTSAPMAALIRPDEDVAALLAAIDLVSALCCTLEENHAPSARRDTLLGSLMRTWMRLSAELARAAGSGVLAQETQRWARSLQSRCAALSSSWTSVVM